MVDAFVCFLSIVSLLFITFLGFNFFFEFLDDVKQWMKQTWVWEMIFEVRWERENRYECLKSSCEENGFAGDDDGLIVPQL